MSVSNKDKVIALLRALETRDQTAIQYVKTDQYIQHNLTIANGLEGFRELSQALPSDTKVNIVRIFSDGDYVFCHVDYNFFGPKVAFDIFRMDDGFIVEHWDNLQEKPTTPNPSGHTLLDGPTTAIDHDKTALNKATISRFIDQVMIHRHSEAHDAFFAGDNYIQHNPNIGDGLSGLLKAFEEFGKQGIRINYQKNHAVLGEGNFVLAVSEGIRAEKPTALYDLFRLENGKIAEHWDVVETIPPEHQWKNKNGKFGTF